MPTKKKSAKKAAKKAATKPAKKAAKKAAKKNATTKATRKTPARKPALAEGLTSRATATYTINDVTPVNLAINDLRGTPFIYYGTTLIDDVLEDVFVATTAVTQVSWVFTNNATYAVDIQFNTENAILLAASGGTTTRVLTMPSPGGSNSNNVTVWKDGAATHDPIIRVKRKSG